MFPQEPDSPQTGDEAERQHWDRHSSLFLVVLLGRGYGLMKKILLMVFVFLCFLSCAPSWSDDHTQPDSCGIARSVVPQPKFREWRLVVRPAIGQRVDSRKNLAQSVGDDRLPAHRRQHKPSGFFCSPRTERTFHWITRCDVTGLQFLVRNVGAQRRGFTGHCVRINRRLRTSSLRYVGSSTNIYQSGFNRTGSHLYRIELGVFDLAGRRGLHNLRRLLDPRGLRLISYRSEIQESAHRVGSSCKSNFARRRFDEYRSAVHWDPNAGERLLSCSIAVQPFGHIVGRAFHSNIHAGFGRS
jgi:hypothetical protein